MFVDQPNPSGSDEPERERKIPNVKPVDQALYTKIDAAVVEVGKAETRVKEHLKSADEARMGE